MGVRLGLTSLLWAAGSGLLCACTVIVAPPAPPHPAQGPAVEVAPGAAKGQPKQAKPGSELGIWIWRGDDGTWHLRSTTKGKRHVFRGLIEGVASPITWFQPDHMELGDSMGSHGQGLVFKFETAGHIDGFDFVPDDHGCVRFHITVDERPQPNRIFLGGSGSHPPSDFFVACP
jgi:hypothetical protein